jgi:hypothetical protein
VDGLIGVMGDRAAAPEEVVVGERLVGDATVNEERLSDSAAVFELPGVFVADRSARPGW